MTRAAAPRAEKFCRNQVRAGGHGGLGRSAAEERLSPVVQHDMSSHRNKGAEVARAKAAAPFSSGETPTPLPVSALSPVSFSRAFGRPMLPRVTSVAPERWLSRRISVGADVRTALMSSRPAADGLAAPAGGLTGSSAVRCEGAASAAPAKAGRGPVEVGSAGSEIEVSRRRESGDADWAHRFEQRRVGTTLSGIFLLACRLTAALLPLDCRASAGLSSKTKASRSAQPCGLRGPHGRFNFL